MGQGVLSISGVTVNYGRARGIRSISLDALGGEVLGLLGPNGAGKTTLIRTVLDFLRPAEGTITIAGVNSRDPQSRSSVAYLPGDFLVPPRLTGQQCVNRFLGKKMQDIEVRHSVSALAQRLEVDLSRPSGALSKGNRQKLGLILAFAPRAHLIILDEPTSGLDPVLQGVFSELVNEAKGTGSCILLSSHVLSELEDLAQSVAVLRHGELVAHESVEQLRSRAHQGVRAQIPIDSERLACLADLQTAGVEAAALGGWLTIRIRGSVDPVIKILSRYSVSALETLDSDLREVFLDFYADHDGDVA